MRNINKESNVNNDIAFNKLQNELKEKSKLLNQEYIEKEEKNEKDKNKKEKKQKIKLTIFSKNKSDKEIFLKKNLDEK